MERIEGTRERHELSVQERQDLASAALSWADAVQDAVDDPTYHTNVDLSWEDASHTTYMAVYMFLALQQERARLGLSWLAESTSERSADGKPIRHGMRVYTNNLDRGTIDLSRAHWSNARGGLKSLWFDVILDHNYRGEPMTGRTSQNAERVATRFEGKDA